MKRIGLVMVAGGAFAWNTAWAHPQILAGPTERETIKAKLEYAPWAKTSYTTLKARVDPLVARCKTNEAFMSSRLFMNWETHYVTPLVRNSRSAGGEGRAPVPSPRFGGARDWATKYQAPAKLEDLKPYNDKAGRVWLFNRETQKEEWADPGLTGRMFETVNERILQSAADAGFIYWITGDETYAKYASDILWTYMKGYSCMQPPRILEGGGERIIGFDSFEVIHEDIVTPLAEAYDFTYDYLRRQGRDVHLIQEQLKRMADRVIDGGNATGNWNLNQARIITYAGLALEKNTNYPDGKGRQYYVDVVLNAKLPAQTGLNLVVQKEYDQASGIWPEAPGYSFGTTKDVVLMASLLGADPAGRALLANPVLSRAVDAQINLLYPNGFAVGMGDTINPRLNTEAVELLLAAARQSSDVRLETRMTGALEREIAAGYYHRDDNANLVALTKYVGGFKPVAPGGNSADRTFVGVPLNVVMQRNVAASPEDSLAAAMFGTAGGHAHANGLAMELYGDGLILGADPGRGVSYWQPEHGEYYSQPPAHNTVIVNGQSSYGAARGQIPMKLDWLEPASGQPGMSPDISFAEASFHYNRPEADQQRTLALVRTGPHSGFYFDVFRSRTREAANAFHDYLYHNLGQSVALDDGHGKPLVLAATKILTSTNGCLKGYDYFREEKSMPLGGDFSVTFTLRTPDSSEHVMRMWMPGEPGRRVFTVSAPPNHAGRDELPAAIAALPMPTVVVRQSGQAWHRPFVAVYEPCMGSDNATITSVRAAKVEGDESDLAACVVEGRTAGHVGAARFRIYLMQDDQPGDEQTVEDCRFAGSFGVVIKRDDANSELYLGHGRIIGESVISLAATNTAPVDATLLRETNGWQYSASAPVKASLVFPLPADWSDQSWTLYRADANGRYPVESARTERTAAGRLMVNCVLPAATGQTLSLEPNHQ